MTMGRSESQQPGRLGNSELTLEADPRLDPRIAAALAMVELAPGLEPPDVGANYDACLAYCAGFEEVNAAQHPQLEALMPEFPGLTSSTETIVGVDGNDIALYIDGPADPGTGAPCLVYFHGGGMVFMTAQDPVFVRWRKSLAANGAVVVGVEFRNGGGRLGTHPFPAGLNDCASAVQWVHANRSQLGISSITLSGESGGGNLSIATALKANREGWVEQIDGVYAMCPYISGLYGAPPDSLPSLVENDGYMMTAAMMNALAKVYDPAGEQATNPLAWPMHAQLEDLRGLPPHVISVNELDPLRDEGLTFYRKLLAAGVSAVGRTVHGTPHAGDGTFPDIVPDVFQDTVNSICCFAQRLSEEAG
jgi:acetyl esterase/lipase